MNRWLPDEPALVISTHCGRDEHGQCPGAWPGGRCGCLCHEPGGEAMRRRDNKE